jgi:hypothetical protein
VDDSDSDDATTESGANDFQRRQWEGDEGERGQGPAAAAADSDEDALPLWENDSADYEELTEVSISPSCRNEHVCVPASHLLAGMNMFVCQHSHLLAGLSLFVCQHKLTPFCRVEYICVPA